MARPDGRPAEDLRTLTLERGASPYAEGSCLASMGNTKVLCTVSAEEGVPGWRRGQGLGWLTAEYAMLPRATTERTSRERRGPGGRTAEIQRLIGRSLRAALRDFEFGEWTLRIDCDVLQADGGTRTAAITGSAVALADACQWLEREHSVASPFGRLICAISVGIVEDEVRLDLSYEEDSGAQVDANVVFAEPEHFVEVQGTAEGRPFTRAEWDAALDIAVAGAEKIFAEQRRVLGW